MAKIKFETDSQALACIVNKMNVCDVYERRRQIFMNRSADYPDEVLRAVEYLREDWDYDVTWFATRRAWLSMVERYEKNKR